METLQSRPTCLECSSSPVNHFFTKLSNGAELYFDLVAQQLARAVPRTRPRKGSRYLFFQKLWPALAAALQAVRIISLHDEISDNATSRSRVVWEEARRRGIPIRQLAVLGRPTELFEVPLRGARRVFQSIPVPPELGNESPRFDDKQTAMSIFASEGIPVPRSFTTRMLTQAQRALGALGRACVKPQLGSNGRHTFPYVTTAEEMRVAFRSVKKLCPGVVVQKHLEGNLARATCVGGKLVGFLESQYPMVTGDGIKTIRELIEKENAGKPDRVEDIEITPLHEAYIARRGYSLDSVLEEGKKLPLIYWAGRLSGGRTWEYGREIHPQLREVIERAARITGLPVVGFDLIIENAQRGPDEQRCGIIEANSLPWIDLHLSPLYGEPVNVAAAVWDLWEEPII